MKYPLSRFKKDSIEHCVLHAIEKGVTQVWRMEPYLTKIDNAAPSRFNRENISAALQRLKAKGLVEYNQQWTLSLR